MLKEGQVRIPAGCAISGIFSRSRKRMNGEAIVQSIGLMHDRSNGLGGGFAGYGIYPEYSQYYAFHLFYDDLEAKAECESFLDKHFDIINLSKIPTKKTPAIQNEPLIWRYFALPLPTKLSASQLDEEEFVKRCVFRINTGIEGTYVFSCGKNMGIFKAVGYPEDVGAFYDLGQYEGYLWTAHGRYPTNTPGWWGGAHPFGLLSYSIVHNGEISSYDANRRFIEMHGYPCTLQTDTEVITYVFDYLHRRKGLTLDEIADVIAAPFWENLEDLPMLDKAGRLFLRKRFASLLITGPFSIIFGFSGGMMVLGDRLKLRSMVVAEKGDTVYAASEEDAIRIIQPDLDTISWPDGGKPCIYTLEGGMQP